MNLYLLTQTENNKYDTYDSCIVCAENEKEAKLISPDGYFSLEEIMKESYSSWVTKIENIICELIGIAKIDLKKGLVLASYNAG